MNQSSTGILMMFSLNKNLEYSGFDEAYHTWVSKKHGVQIKAGDSWPGFKVRSKKGISEFKKQVSRFLAGGNIIDESTFGSATYGKSFSCSCSMRIYDNEGKVSGVTILLNENQDSTVKIITDSELLNLELVAKNVQNSVVITDSKRKVEYVNDAFEKITGYSFAEMKGKSLSILQGKNTKAEDIKKMDKGLKKKEPFSIEILNYSKSGKEYWLEVFITPIFDKKGKISKFIGIQNDITERKAFEETSRRNEAQYLAIINSLHEGVVVQGINDTIIVANNSAAKILGLTKDQLLGKDSFDPRWKALNADGTPLDPTEHPTMVTLRTGKPVTNFIMNVHVGNKSRKIISINSEPVKDNKGKMFAVVATFLDVTKQIATQKELRDSEERYRLLVENAPVGILLHMDGKIKIRNHYAARLLEEKSRNTLINKPFLNIIHPDFRDIVRYRYERLKSGKVQKLEEIEEKLVTLDGKNIDVLKSGIAVSYKGKPAFLTVFSDISTIKETEKLVKANQERLSNLANSVPGALLQYKINADGTDELLYVSEQVIDLWEVSKKEALNDVSKLWDPVLKEDLPGMQDSIMNSAMSMTFWDHRWRIKTKSGNIKWLNGRGIPKRLDDASVIWDSLILDITDLKKAETLLEETNKQLELAVDTAKLGIWTYDIQLDKLTWNDILYEIYNIKKEEFTNHLEGWTWKVHKDDAKIAKEEFDQILNGHVVFNSQFRIHPTPDTIKHIQGSGAPFKDEHGTIQKLIGIDVDITEFVEKEEKLEEALKAKNTLLKELHHRIKNNLNLISNLLYLKSKSTKDKALLDYIKETNTRINTIAKTHDQLLRLEEFDQLDIKDYLEDLISTLIATYTSGGSAFTLKSNIEHYNLSVDKILVIGLLTNEIILNTIKYAYEPGIGGPVFLTFKKLKESIRLTVYDKGKGIPAKILKNRNSTGLNLINLLTQQLKGSVRLESEKGVKYVIDFPLEG
ncbi:MAG: PAS domain S-box protein [Bacteroidota bacterium]